MPHPLSRDIGQVELEREVALASRLYKQAIADLYPSYSDQLEVKCTAAAPVLAAYLRQTKGVDAHMVAGLYIHLSPRVSWQYDEDIAMRAESAARHYFTGDGESVFRRHYMIQKDGERKDRQHLIDQTHEFVLIKRRGGDFFFVDLTYRQFGNATFQGDFIVDVVDAKKLLFTYGLVILSPDTQKGMRQVETKIERGRFSIDLYKEDTKANMILTRMLQLRKDENAGA